jgi:hypothetical protein
LVVVTMFEDESALAAMRDGERGSLSKGARRS